MRRKIRLLYLVLILTLTGCGRAGNPEKNEAPAAESGNAAARPGAESGPVETEPGTESGPAETEPATESGPAETEPATESGPAETGAAAESVENSLPGQAGKTEDPYGSVDVDVDLTTLSSTMVYSEVFNMLSNPEQYLGKTVKMKGIFADYHDEETGSYYFACIIQDATACCEQGIEFVLTDDYVYPDDYPEIYSEISVQGVFDTYQEGEYTYCTLKDAVLL